MCRRSIVSLGALLSILSLPAGAWADLPYTNYVWFEATSLNPQSGVLSQGAQEADLRLACDTSAGPTLCEWSLAMRMHSTQQFGGMGTNLLGDTNKHAIVNLLHGGEFPSDGHYLFTEVNTGGTLARLKEANIPILPGPIYDPTDGAAGDYLLATMTLRTFKAAGEMTTDGINATINELLWADVNESGSNEPTYVMFGDGPVLDGSVQGGLAECITIRNIPEPATLALIVTSLCLSVNRRR
ncbi:MAG TPA: PEP-CTERM sorting domain-containing protein [Phycisphaerae bacterium]|nr:PEP-CTERM sorting domain-containing protein [Phycisphaerae bacterium]